MKEQKIALVTGANRGIGFAIAQELLQKGYRVIVTARTEAAGQKVSSQLKAYGDMYFHRLDITKDASVEAIKQYVEQEFGRLDILINNAGINFDTWHSASDADLSEIQATLDTNLMGAWRMDQAFLPVMIKQNYGRIVHVSSGAGAFSDMSGNTPGYSISKAALNALTIHIAADVLGKNILVNSVCPGWVRTDMGGSAAPRSPQQGAETVIWAAELPDNGPSGSFFRDKKEIAW